MKKEYLGRAGILQENHYYPFGMNQEGKWLNNAALPDTKYQYNGKELNEDLGLNWNHQDARWYDFSINRWVSVDPVTEGQEDFNPYHFSYDNPVRFNDPDGNTPITGALIGAGVEVGVQILTGLSLGKSFTDAVREIDIVDVGIAALAGAASGGLSTTSKFGQIAKFAAGAGGAVAEAAVDGSVKEGVKIVGGDKTIGEGIVDLAAGPLVAGKISGTVKEAVDLLTNSKSIKAAETSIKVAQKHVSKAFTERGKDIGKKMLNNATNNLLKKQGSGTAAEAAVNIQIDKKANQLKDHAKEKKYDGFRDAK